MRMNISVPDQLAEEVRQRDIPISAICQRALRDEVTRQRTAEIADDISVIFNETEMDFGNPDNWAPQDPGKPALIYQRHRERGFGWTLLYKQSDVPWENPAAHFISGRREDFEIALRSAREFLRRTGMHGEMREIAVEIGEPPLAVGFTGRWLLEPDSDRTRTGEDGWDTGTYWGIALTHRGRIAVFSAHCNAGHGHLDDYDSLDQAADHVPADIIARAAVELGEDRVLWRDI